MKRSFVIALTLLLLPTSAIAGGSFRGVHALVRADRAAVKAGKLQRESRTRFRAAKGKAKGSVLLIHGFSAWSGQMEHVARRLQADGYNVLSMRQQGHGWRRDGAPFAGLVPKLGGAKYGPQAKRAFRALRQTTDGKVHVVGFSGGGTAAMWLKAKYPNAIDRTVLFAPFVGPKRKIKQIGSALLRFADKLTPNIVRPVINRIPATALGAYRRLPKWLQKIIPRPRAKRDRPGHPEGITYGQQLALAKFGVKTARKFKRATARGKIDPKSIVLVTAETDEVVSNRHSSKIVSHYLGARWLEYPAQPGLRHDFLHEKGGAPAKIARQSNPDLVSAIVAKDAPRIEQAVKQGGLVDK